MNMATTDTINAIPMKIGMVEMIVFKVVAMSNPSGTGFAWMMGIATAVRRITPMISPTIPSVNPPTLNLDILVPPVFLFPFLAMIVTSISI